MSSPRRNAKPVGRRCEYPKFGPGSVTAMGAPCGQQGTSGTRNRNRRSDDEFRTSYSDQERNHLETSAGVLAEDAEDGHLHPIVHGSGYIPEEDSESEAGIGDDTDDMRESRDMGSDYRRRLDSDGQDPEPGHWLDDANDELQAASGKGEKTTRLRRASQEGNRSRTTNVVVGHE